MSQQAKATFEMTPQVQKKIEKFFSENHKDLNLFLNRMYHILQILEKGHTNASFLDAFVGLTVSIHNHKKVLDKTARFYPKIKDNIKEDL